MKTILIISAIMFALPAYSQQMFSVNQASDAKSILIGLPVYMGEEYGARLEYNLGSGSIAVEAVKVSKGQEYSEEEVKENGYSLVAEGYEAALYISRFSKPRELGGFFWSLALGYRHLDAVWKRPIDASLGLDVQENTLVNEMTISGYTGHGRLGYRYVSSSFPVYIGGAFGFRHFENKFEDKSDANNSTPSTDDERYRLKRMMMTRPEIGLEAGLVF